jgi:hypothetical protein
LPEAFAYLLQAQPSAHVVIKSAISKPLIAATLLAIEEFLKDVSDLYLVET